jgi:DNA-binding NarL/FixJ family response regulator
MTRFSRILSTHEDSPPAVLSWLASFDDPSVQSRIAEHPNTPATVLHRLGAHHDPEVRGALADNPCVPFDLLMRLSRDEHPDVRYRIAENANIHHDVLAILCDDENPFVAQRAKQSMSQRWQSRPPAETDKLNILIIEDDEVTRFVLSLALRTDPLINVVGQASTGDEGVSLARLTEPDIVLMDIGMPGTNGIAVTAKIKAMLPDTKVIMVTAHDSLEEIVGAFGNGADGYHLKSTPTHDLAKAIRVVASGAYWLDPGLASLVLREMSRRSLSILQKMSDESALPSAEQAHANIENPVESMIKIGDSFVQNEKLQEALQIYQSALTLSQSLYGEDAPVTSKAMSKVAELYLLEEEYSNAESIYLDLIKLQSQLHELDDPALENHLWMLAEFYAFRWNYQQAELFYTWLLRVREKSGDMEKINQAKDRLHEIARKSS